MLDVAVELGADACGLGPVQPLLYVEREVHAAAILAARMEDGSLAPAPVWSDLTTAPGRRLRGMVDLVVAGLPCQPYSVAGRRKGHDDERAIWPAFFRLVDGCGARMVFLENVAGFLDYWPPVREQFTRRGYRVMGPLLLRASDVGASHQRKRFFALAYNEEHIGGREQIGLRWGTLPASIGATCADVAHRAPGGRGELREPSRCGGLADGGHGPVDDASDGLISLSQRGPAPGDGFGPAGEELAYGIGAGWPGWPGQPGDAGPECTPAERDRDELGLFAPGPGDPAWPAILSAQPFLAPAGSRLWYLAAGAAVAGLLDYALVGGTPAEIGRALAKACVAPEAKCTLRRVADGVARWLDGRPARLRACGNGVVELQGAAAFALLVAAAGLGDVQGTDGTVEVA